MIPFSPKSMNLNRARYKAALRDWYSAEKCAAGQQERPGNKAKHVFDFEDGIRLIISRDRNNGKEYIHVSGSGTDEYMSDKGLFDAKRDMENKFRELCQKNVPMKFIVLSEGGIPHWIIELEILN